MRVDYVVLALICQQAASNAADSFFSNSTFFAALEGLLYSWNGSRPKYPGARPDPSSIWITATVEIHSNADTQSRICGIAPVATAASWAAIDETWSVQELSVTDEPKDSWKK